MVGEDLGAHPASAPALHREDAARAAVASRKRAPRSRPAPPSPQVVDRAVAFVRDCQARRWLVAERPAAVAE
jgi:hypothetical protein